MTSASGPVLLGATILLVVVAWFFTDRRVDRLLAVLALYLGLLDGYLKLRTGIQLFTLMRDLLVVAIATGVLLRSTRSGQTLRLPPLAGLVIAFAAIVVIELFNPRGPDLTHGVAGLRQHLEFVPLFFLGYAFVRRESQLRAFLLILVVCAAAGGIVSLIQSLLTPEQLAHWGPGYSQRIFGTGAFAGAGRIGFDAAGGAQVRPFGLGSEVGAGAAVAALALPGLITLIMSAPARTRITIAPLAVGVALAVVTSGSRAATVTAFLSVIAFAVLATVSRNSVRAVIGLAIGAVVLYGIYQQVGNNAAKDRAQSVAPTKIVSTFSQERGNSVKALGGQVMKYPLGLGVGTVGPAAAISGQRNDSGLTAETLWSFLVLETGLPGLLILLALIGRLMWLSVTRIRRIADPATRLYLAALAAPVFSIMAAGFAGPTTISVPSGPFLWTVTGVLSYWLVTLPKAERHTAVASPLPSTGASISRAGPRQARPHVGAPH